MVMTSPMLRRRPLLLSTCAALAGVPVLGGCAGSLGVVAFPGTASGERMSESPASTGFDRAALDRELSSIVTDPASRWAQVSTLAIRGGQVVYGGHFGRRYIHPTDRALDLPVNERTMFRIASISKLVVSVAVMRLVDEGRLDLDADVSEALGWRLRHPQHPQTPLSLRLLMSHRSGLNDAGGYNWGADVALREALQPGGRLYRNGAAWRRDRAPGTWFNYTNLNWGVIGTVMERATGERFDRLMHRLVLQPLGLRGGFNPAALPGDDAHDIATLYRKRRMEGEREMWEPGGPWVPQADDHRPGRPRPPTGLEAYVPGTNGTLFGPQGSLRISVADLGTLMQMLMNGGQHRGQALLSPRALDLLASEQWRFDPARPNGDTLDDEMLAWALGPQRFTDASAPGRGDRLIEGGGLTGWGHLGDAYGLLACFVLDPRHRNGMITVISGPSRNPYTPKGRWSAMARDEERLWTALWRGAVQAHRT
jgi:CubicO group peptidase (beta-lactamase class C family)